MPSMSATINGWRSRTRQTWYPTSGIWADCSGNTNVNVVASCPTTSSGELSTNMHTTIIKATMPSTNDMDYISSISFCINVYDVNNVSGYLYGSLRTVDDNTEAQYSLNDYRTHVAGNSAEVHTSPDYYQATPNNYYYTFTGTFTPGATYYLWLYTKSTADSYQLQPSSTAYTCEVEYKTKTCKLFYDANGGYEAPESAEYNYNTVCTVNTAPPCRDADISSTAFIITGIANGGNENKSVTATKTITTSYTFNGWSTSSSATTAEYKAGDTFTITSNTTLYAVWGYSTYIGYSNNSLANLPKPTRSYESAVYELKMNEDNGNNIISKTLEKSTTYTFSGWSLSSNGSILDINTKYENDITVYAIWSADNIDTTVIALPIPTKEKATVGSHVVTLNPGEGSVNPTKLTANIGTEYKFIGWSTTTSVDNIVSSPYTVTKDTTLTAIWESEFRTDSLLIPSAVKDGYVFKGWAYSIDSTNYVEIPYTPTDSVTLHAIYNIGKEIQAFLWHGNKWYRILLDVE